MKLMISFSQSVFFWICLKRLIPFIILFYQISFLLMVSWVLPTTGLKAVCQIGMCRLTMYLLNIYRSVVPQGSILGPLLFIILH